MQLWPQNCLTKLGPISARVVRSDENGQIFGAAHITYSGYFKPGGVLVRSGPKCQ